MRERERGRERVNDTPDRRHSPLLCSAAAGATILYCVDDDTRRETRGGGGTFALSRPATTVRKSNPGIFPSACPRILHRDVCILSSSSSSTSFTRRPLLCTPPPLTSWRKTGTVSSSPSLGQRTTTPGVYRPFTRRVLAIAKNHLILPHVPHTRVF